MLELLHQDLCKYNHHWPFQARMWQTLCNSRFWPVLLYFVCVAGRRPQPGLCQVGILG